MIEVLALVDDFYGRVELEGALRGRALLTCCHERAQLLRLVLERRPHAVVISLLDRDRGVNAEIIRAVRAHDRSVRIVAYCWLNSDDVREIIQLARNGIDDVVFHESGDFSGVLYPFAGKLEASAVARRTLGSLEDRVPAITRPILAYCVAHLGRHVTVKEIAVALGVSRTALANRLLRIGLPAPSVIVSWSRLLAAAVMIEQQVDSVEAIALALQFSSGTALRNMLKRYTGLRPRQLRTGLGFEAIAAESLALFDKVSPTRPASIQRVLQVTSQVEQPWTKPSHSSSQRPPTDGVHSTNA